MIRRPDRQRGRMVDSNRETRGVVDSVVEPVYRMSRPSDEAELLDVIQAAYGTWPAFPLAIPAIEHLHWKMNPPAETAVQHSVIQVGDRIAAAQLRWVSRWQVQDEVRLAEAGADLAVHPDFQGHGFSRLIRTGDHRRLIAGGISGVAMQSKAPEVRHMNQGKVGREMTTWTYPFRMRPYIGAHRRHGPRQLARALWRRSRPQRGRIPPVGRIEVLERFDERTDALWEASRRSFDVIPFRDSIYLNWRFQRPFSGEPEILCWLDGDRALAYAVVRRSGEHGYLMDWLWRPGTIAGLGALVEACIEHLRDAGASDATCWVPKGHPGAPLLEATGFARTGTQTMEFGNRQEESGERLNALDFYDDPSTSFHLTMSDFDYV